MAKLHLAVLDKTLDVTVTPSFLSEAECPASVKYGRIDKMPRRADLPLEVGRAVHAIFERVLRARQGRKATDVEFITATMLACVSTVAVNELTEIRRMTDLFLTNFHPELSTIVGVEERVGLDENGEPTPWENAAYGGILDLVQIEGVVGVVTDHKAQYNIMSKDELDRHFQGTFYLVLLRKLYPFLRRFILKIYYARHGFTATTERTTEQLDACEQEIMIRVEAIKKWKNFDPIPGAHCTICDGRFDCPKGKDLSPVPAGVITVEQATSVAGRIRVMELVLKDLKKRLKEYCKENGDAAASPTWRFGFVQKSKVEFPTGAVILKMMELGMDPAPHQRMDTSSLRKFLKQLEHHDVQSFQEVMSVANTKATTTFKGYRPGSEDEEDDE